MKNAPIIIIGAGHSGVQAAASLREEGYTGGIILIDKDPALPYQRPPLSKAYMKGETSLEAIVLRGEAFYAENKIDLRLGESVASINPMEKKITLESGEELHYAHLILSTGARARKLPLKGATLKGVFELRDAIDATNISAARESAKNIVIIGAGFIGLEFAAVVASKAKVTVLDFALRAMERAVSPEISHRFEAMHRALGVDLRFSSSVTEIEGDGSVEAVRLTDGTKLAADMVLMAVGVLAEDHLAQQAGLACNNGIVVDENLLTSDPHISAIGDAASYPNHYLKAMARLESVQNAIDQAKALAARIMGKPAPYIALPWFWSDQAHFKLQIVGVAQHCDDYVLRGTPENEACTVFGFMGEKLLLAQSINRPAEHMAARRLIGNQIPISKAQVADLTFDLKKAITG